jgi:hypothetical protein
MVRTTLPLAGSHGQSGRKRKDSLVVGSTRRCRRRRRTSSRRAEGVATTRGGGMRQMCDHPPRGICARSADSASRTCVWSCLAPWRMHRPPAPHLALSLATDVVLHVVCSLCASPHGRAPGRRGGSVIDTVPVFVAATHGFPFLSHTARHPLSSCPGGNEEVGHSDGDRSKAGQQILI